MSEKNKITPQPGKIKGQPEVPKGMFRNKNVLLIVFMVMLGLVLVNLYSSDLNSERVSRTKFLEWMSNSDVSIRSLRLQKAMDGVIVTGERLLSEDELKSRPTQSPLVSASKRDRGGVVNFRTHMLEVSNEMQSQWEKAKGIEIAVVHESTGWVEQLFAFLPILLLVGLFWFMMSRQNGPGGGRGIFNFGKSRAKLLTGDKPKTSFKEVAGCDEAKTDLEEVIDFLKNPKKYDKLGGKIPRGVLLLGPPGTGKTLLARAVAGEAEVPFFSMSGSDFVEMFVGVGASRVRDLFDTGKKHAPCILFIDEIDAVGRQRGAGLGGGHDEREQTLNQLLVEMDGFESNNGVILIAATNRADVLDRALLRPGRFDRQIVVDAPDAKGREAILKVHLDKRKVPLSDDVNLQTIARGTPGLSGADIENLVNEAALMAARYDSKKVAMLDFEEAKDKIMMGAERRSRVLTEEEKRTTAYHEAGHALITTLVENSDPLHKITIIPRGMALGITFSLPEKDRYTMSKEFIEDQIAILLGGRGAELLIFNQRTTGASNDIERASELARRMVTEWGMTDDLGPIAFGKKKEEVFLGRQIAEHRDYSNRTAEAIDIAVRGIVEGQLARVEKLLDDNRKKLIALSEALLAHEVLDREEIQAVLDGEDLESSKKSRYFQQQEKALADRKEREKREVKEKKKTESAEGTEKNADNSAEDAAVDNTESEKKGRDFDREA